MAIQWLDIAEYSRHFGISISTIRRRIKDGTFEVKKGDGKYLIKVSSERLSEQASLVLENKELRREIRFLQQEIQELKMLVNIYEAKGPVMTRDIGPPAIPR